MNECSQIILRFDKIHFCLSARNIFRSRESSWMHAERFDSSGVIVRKIPKQSTLEMRNLKQMKEGRRKEQGKKGETGILKFPMQ